MELADREWKRGGEFEGYQEDGLYVRVMLGEFEGVIGMVREGEIDWEDMGVLMVLGGLADRRKGYIERWEGVVATKMGITVKEVRERVGKLGAVGMVRILEKGLGGFLVMNPWLMQIGSKAAISAAKRFYARA
jgi:hypothetical protein